MWKEPWIETDLDNDVNPVGALLDQNIDILINIAASPFEYKKHQKRVEILSEIAKTNSVDVIFVNQVGANDQLIFDGGSFALNKKAEVITQLDFFNEDSNFSHNSITFLDSSSLLLKVIGIITICNGAISDGIINPLSSP